MLGRGLHHDWHATAQLIECRQGRGEHRGSCCGHYTLPVRGLNGHLVTRPCALTPDNATRRHLSTLHGLDGRGDVGQYRCNGRGDGCDVLRKWHALRLLNALGNGHARGYCDLRQCQHLRQCGQRLVFLTEGLHHATERTNGLTDGLGVGYLDLPALVAQLLLCCVVFIGCLQDGRIFRLFALVLCRVGCVHHSLFLVELNLQCSQLVALLRCVRNVPFKLLSDGLLLLLTLLLEVRGTQRLGLRLVRGLQCQHHVVTLLLVRDGCGQLSLGQRLVVLHLRNLQVVHFTCALCRGLD